MKLRTLSVATLCACILSLSLVTACSGAQEKAVWNEDEPFSYSKGLNDDGYWDGINALDYVELIDNYQETIIPAETHAVSEEDIQTQVDSFLGAFSESEQITDRAAEDGDTLNIDYAGSIDGVEFEGGSTQGAGAEVTIGETKYIDGFLEQLVGHTPGETFDIQVTFPDEYGNEELNGKEATFDITINYLVEIHEPELSDAFVRENLEAEHGWTTVQEMRDAITQELQNKAIDTYLTSIILEKGNVSSVPDSLIKYNEESFYAYYEETAQSFGVGLDEFVTSYMGAESMEALVKDSSDLIRENAEIMLIIQAIAEDQSFKVSEDDVAAFFKEMGIDDYSGYEESFGMPYLKQMLIYQNVTDLLKDHAVLA